MNNPRILRMVKISDIEPGPRTGEFSFSLMVRIAVDSSEVNTRDTKTYRSAPEADGARKGLRDYWSGQGYQVQMAGIGDD